MRKITIEEIAFFILIMAIIGLAVWKLIGSPTDTASLIALAFLVASSELLLWKYLFKSYYELDKKVAVSFVNMKNEMDKRFDKIENLIGGKK
jgi:hypothetical protein